MRVVPARNTIYYVSQMSPNVEVTLMYVVTITDPMVGELAILADLQELDVHSLKSCIELMNLLIGINQTCMISCRVQDISEFIDYNIRMSYKEPILSIQQLF